jgi:drug/metabolite transporter (DMT)-like permease
VHGAPVPRWLGVVLLMLVATTFGGNHVAARVAFDHGANVTTAVAARSLGTTLFVLVLLRAQRVPIALPAGLRWRAAVIGVLIAVQSYCIYSAVARMPVALALLAFNTAPLLFVLISWAAGGERLSRRALVAMPVALVGLALALDVMGKSGDMAGRWAEIGPGVGYALGAAVSFANVFYLNGRWLNSVDGRVRTLVTMGVVAVIACAAGVIAGDFRFPMDGTGWLGLGLLTLFYGTAFTALFMLLPRIGAASNTVALNFEPIAVLFLAWLILGQSVAPLQIFGAFMVVGAIMALGAAK